MELISQFSIGLARQMLPINPQLLSQLPGHFLLRALELGFLLFFDNRAHFEDFEKFVELAENVFGEVEGVEVYAILELSPQQSRLRLDL